MTPDVSTVNPEVFGDFMAKMQAAVSAGNPPDLTYHGTSIAQMFDLELTEDHTALADELVKAYGDIVPTTASRNAKFEDKWWAVPHSSNIGGWFVRKDVAAAAGVDLTKFNTLQERLDAAVKMSDASKEMYGWGMTVNKSGDGHGLITTAFQAFGGRAVDETGKKVTFNSPETVEGVKWLAAIYSDEKYKGILPPGVEAWTDPTQQRGLFGGQDGHYHQRAQRVCQSQDGQEPGLRKHSLAGLPQDQRRQDGVGQRWQPVVHHHEGSQERGWREESHHAHS